MASSQFTKWLEDYNKLIEEVKGLPLVNIKEVLSVGGHHFVISLGKENGVFEDDRNITPRFMRPYFSAHKQEFADCLETLKTRTKEAREFVVQVVNALTEEAVPEVVMARMRGEAVETESFKMLEMAVKKKMGDLVKTAHATTTPLAFVKVIIPVAGHPLSLLLNKEISETELSWASITAQIYTVSVQGIEHQMFFLTNYKFIEEALVELCEKISRVLEVRPDQCKEVYCADRFI